VLLLGALGSRWRCRACRCICSAARFTSARTRSCAPASRSCSATSHPFAIGIKTFAIAEKLLPPDKRMDRFFKVATLERGLIVGIVAMLIGLGLLSAAVAVWVRKDSETSTTSARCAGDPGATLIACGFQTVLSASSPGSSDAAEINARGLRLRPPPHASTDRPPQHPPCTSQ